MNFEYGPTYCNTSKERIAAKYVLFYKAVIIAHFAMNCLFYLLLKPLTREQNKMCNFISIDFARLQCDSE